MKRPIPTNETISANEREEFQQAMENFTMAKEYTLKVEPVQKFHLPLVNFDLANIDKPLTATDLLSFRRGGVRDKVWRQLKKGLLDCEMTIDLHGLTVNATEIALQQCFEEALHNRYQVLLMIHGKGHKSKNNLPVLKNYLNELLPLIDEVLAFCQAQQKHGGLGAIYVLLKKTGA